MVVSALEPPLASLVAALRLTLGSDGHGPDQTAIRSIADWNAVAGLARRHGVVSLAWRGVRASGCMPPGAEAAFAPLRRQATMNGLQQLAGLRVAAASLAGAGIAALVLKGLPLSERLFGSPLDRDCIDIDLLVSPAAVSSAEQALSRNGWRLLKPSFRPTPARVRCYDRFAKDRLLVGPGGRLELHHRLVTNPHLIEGTFDSLSARARPVEVGDQCFNGLGDEDLFIYLAVHGRLHRFSRLKWLCDIAALIAATDDDCFEAVIERCERQGLAPQAVFGTALLLCRELLHVELPSGAERVALGAGARRATRSTSGLWRSPRGARGFRGVARRIDETRSGLAMKPSWRAAAYELARLCLPPYDFGMVDLPDKLFFLYVPLRPVLWIGSRLQRAKARRQRRRTIARLALGVGKSRGCNVDGSE